MRSAPRPVRATTLFVAAAMTLGFTGAASASDSWDKEATEPILNRAARQVHANCGQARDENGKATGPWGKTKVSLTLGHNGRSKGATVPPPFDGSPSGKCTVAAFKTLYFPPWNGADLTLEWDVEIPEPADSK